MPSVKRFRTKYPGVYFIEGTSAAGKSERIFYIRYFKGGKYVEEKAGRQFQDNMTPAQAARIRAARIEGKELSNQEKRDAERAERAAAEGRWIINKLWTEYKAGRPNLKGIVTDQNRFQNYLAAAFGEKEPAEIIALDVDRLRIRLSKKLSPATVRNILELLRRIVNFGVKKNLCSGLSFTIEMPALNNEKTEDLTPEQLSSLLAAMNESENQDAANMMRLALFTGLRRGEIFRLRWSDINFERGFIHLKDPKGGRDEQIPLNSAARQLLETHSRTASEYVFPGRGGGQRTCVKRAVNRIKEVAGIPKSFRALHGLRHCFASMLASSGRVDLYVLQKLLTHKSPSMTARYSHLRDEALRGASELAGDIVTWAAEKTEPAETQAVVNLEDHHRK